MVERFHCNLEEKSLVEIAASSDISVCAAEFFDLIDLANSQNAKSQLGHDVCQIGPDRFALTMSFLPELAFELTIEESIPNSLYCYLSPMPEGIGQLLWTRERFEITPAGKNSCRVVVQTTGEFMAGMAEPEYALEVATLTVGCENALAKLKIHAEGGIEQVREFERSQMP